jgi:hypothetical protein
MKRELIFLLILILFSPSITFSQIAGNGREFSTIPRGPQVIPTTAQIDAWKSFKATRGSGWQIRWNDKTGVPASLMGLPVDISGGNPEEVAKQKNIIKDDQYLYRIDRFSDSYLSLWVFTQLYQNV